MKMPAHDCSWHGGADALGLARFDFSTNANVYGPCPLALQLVQAANASHYPDPVYTALRQSLADFHGVARARVLLCASASEAIFRFSAWAAQQGLAQVFLPPHHYSDYARAAQAHRLPTTTATPDEASPGLIWACEPSSPLGQAHTNWPAWLLASNNPDQAATAPSQHCIVLDSAYAPLRLTGQPSLSPAQTESVWQLFSPNKVLGLTGVRGAYLIAPAQTGFDVEQFNTMAPSWPLGAHASAMLQAWTQPEVQSWLQNSRQRLRQDKARQIELLQGLGWQVLPSLANYFCARPARPLNLPALRQQHAIKLRPTGSFGLHGSYRLRVMGDAAQAALAQALAGT